METTSNLSDSGCIVTRVAKIIEFVGSSEKGWTEAAQAALDEAKKNIKEITALEVNDVTASVDLNTHTIKEYKVGVKIAFGVSTELR
jgi:flavin-binding protein dodecin